MKLFEHFPEPSICPICGTNEDKPCFLMPIDGTQQPGENICEAQPAHTDCISENLHKIRYNKAVGIVYMFVEK